MEKHDETCETNNIMEEKILSVLSDSAGIEKVASETTSPVISTESSYLKDKLLRVLKSLVHENLQVSQYERMFSHLDKDGDGKLSSAELQQCLEEAFTEKFAKLLEDEFYNYMPQAFLTSNTYPPPPSVELLRSKPRFGKDHVKEPHFSMSEHYMAGVSDIECNLVDHKFYDGWAMSRWMTNYMHALSGRKVKADGENTLPLSRNDLKNALVEEKALNRKHFLPFAVESVLDISPQHHGILLTSCGGLLSYLAKNSSTPFEFQFGKTTVPSLLSFEEAVFAFFPEMAHIALFMIFYIMTWMLVLPLRSGVQMFFMLLLISAPIFYFPELVRKASASRVHVACGGSFKPSLIGFTALGAFGIALIFGFVALLVFYLIWRFVYGRRPARGKEIEVSLDDLLSLISNV